MKVEKVMVIMEKAIWDIVNSKKVGHLFTEKNKADIYDCVITLEKSHCYSVINDKYLSFIISVLENLTPMAIKKTDNLGIDIEVEWKTKSDVLIQIIHEVSETAINIVIHISSCIIDVTMIQLCKDHDMATLTSFCFNLEKITMAIYQKSIEKDDNAVKLDLMDRCCILS